jgi:hypothetical protein
MKATIKIDASPREMRALLGLPDVEALQQELVEKLRDKALAGIEANSPAELMKLLLPTADQFKSLETMQASFWKSFAQGATSPEDDEDKDKEKQ